MENRFPLGRGLLENANVGAAVLKQRIAAVSNGQSRSTTTSRAQGDGGLHPDLIDSEQLEAEEREFGVRLEELRNQLPAYLPVGMYHLLHKAIRKQQEKLATQGAGGGGQDGEGGASFQGAQDDDEEEEDASGPSP
ncbi:unnamed protein product [Amoebophrya sp. A25]|nr:unnamed protein product [Amoebophrya sp. A25]|eukprot:GSA25T00019150001.1